MAERVGFEPTLEFPLNTLSKRAPSTTRPSLLMCERADDRADSSSGVGQIALQSSIERPLPNSSQIELLMMQSRIAGHQHRPAKSLFHLLQEPVVAGF